jgi:hypothetical protein
MLFNMIIIIVFTSSGVVYDDGVGVEDGATTAMNCHQLSLPWTIRNINNDGEQ